MKKKFITTMILVMCLTAIGGCGKTEVKEKQSEEVTETVEEIAETTGESTDTAEEVVETDEPDHEIDNADEIEIIEPEHFVDEQKRFEFDYLKDWTEIIVNDEKPEVTMKVCVDGVNTTTIIFVRKPGDKEETVASLKESDVYNSNDTFVEDSTDVGEYFKSSTVLVVTDSSDVFHQVVVGDLGDGEIAIMEIEDNSMKASSDDVAYQMTGAVEEIVNSFKFN